MRAFLLLGFLAALAGAAAAQEGQSRAYYYEQIFEPFFTLKGSEYVATRPGAKPGRFSARKPADGLRVFVLGGSIAQRYMSPGHGGDLADLLPAVLPGRKIEALNCGMAGYDSYREALLLEEVLDHQPDLIILLTGHNEALASPPVPLWTLHAADRLSRLSAFRAVVSGLRRRRQDQPVARAAGARDRAFEANLRAMIRRARARGVAIAVASPPLDYRDAAPSVPLPFDDPAFVAGRLLHLRGDDAGALARWAVVPPSDGRAPWLFSRARVEQRLGRNAAASADYAAALEADADAGGRCGPRCQRLIRRVAAEEGAIWLDLDGAFLRRARPGLPGLDMFQDAVHWKHGYDPLVTATIVDTLRKSPGTRDWPWSESGVSALRRRAAASGRDEADDDLSTLRYALSEANRDDGALSPRALSFLEWAQQRRPDWFSSGEALLRRSQSNYDPRRAWTGQGAPAPSPAMLALHLGELWLERGDLRRAQSELAASVSAQPAPAVARLDLAAVEAWLGRRREAAAALARIEAEEQGRRRRATNYREALGL